MIDMTVSNQNKAKAWMYFEQHGYSDHVGMVLHHKDPELKYDDPERYHQWLIEDLQPMDKREHRSLHMSIQQAMAYRTYDHNRRISNGLKERSLSGKQVIITKDVLSYICDSCQDAAEIIGCSRQLVSQCLRPNQPNRKARGWTVESIDIEVDPNEE